MIAGRVVLLFCVFHWAHKSCCLLVTWLGGLGRFRYEELQQKLLDRENFEDLEAPEKRTELTPEEVEAIELDLMKKGGLSYEEWKGQA